MKPTTKQFIIDFLVQQKREGKNETFGGVIEDYLRTKNGSKGESTSRLCRMLENEGILEAVYIPRKDGGRPNVAYKLNETNTTKAEKQNPTPQNDRQGGQGFTRLVQSEVPKQEVRELRASVPTDAPLHREITQRTFAF